MYFLIDYENVKEGTEFLEKSDTVSFFYRQANRAYKTLLLFYMYKLKK